MSFLCEYPEHQGSRIVAHPNDRFVKKVTYRRMDAAVRLHERSGIRLCRTCVDLDAKINDPNQTTLL